MTYMCVQIYCALCVLNCYVLSSQRLIPGVPKKYTSLTNPIRSRVFGDPLSFFSITLRDFELILCNLVTFPII